MTTPPLTHAPTAITPLAILRNLDLVVAVLALPLFVATGLPIAGYATGAGTYALQRAIQGWTKRRAAASNDPRTIVGLLAGSMIGRGWLVAFTIFAVGFWGSHAAGLSGAVLFIALFTVFFSLQMILRPFELDPEGPRS
jgi:hypothetical protein